MLTELSPFTPSVVTAKDRINRDTISEIVAKLLRFYTKPVIEFTGMPLTAKTTCLNRLATQAQHAFGPEQVHFIQEGIASVSPHIRQFPYLAQAYSTMTTLRAITDAVATEPIGNLKSGVILVDRGPHDRKIFTGAMTDDGQIDDEQALLLMQLSDQYVKHVSILCIFMALPETSLNRKRVIKQIKPNDPIMNSHFLNRLFVSFVDYISISKRYFPANHTGVVKMDAERSLDNYVDQTVSFLMNRVIKLHKVADAYKQIFSHLN